jgi:hypothetical protein
MRNTLNIIGKTFQSLGQQSSQVAGLRPAIEASKQVLEIRTQLRTQYDVQGQRLDKIKTYIREGIKAEVHEKVKPNIHRFIEEKVAEKVKERVCTQLQKQIPDDLRKEIDHHRRQISHIQTTLHNSEARRNNGRLQRSEPLSALLRPPSATGATEETATQSPLFPKTLPQLLSLSPDSLRTLAADYRLVDSSAAGDVQHTQEDLLNMIMAHIGVPFQTLPGSGSDSSPPLITRVTRSE